MKTSSGRDEKPCHEPSQCRSCQAEILWAVTRTGKRMPLDAVADNRPPPKGGIFVLAIHGGEFGHLIVSKFDAAKHDSKRNRYTAHWATCPSAEQHRR
jgi:hypothetical protein